MKKHWMTVVAVALIVVMAGAALAQDAAKPARPQRGQRTPEQMARQAQMMALRTLIAVAAMPEAEAANKAFAEDLAAAMGDEADAMNRSKGMRAIWKARRDGADEAEMKKLIEAAKVESLATEKKLMAARIKYGKALLAIAEKDPDKAAAAAVDQNFKAIERMRKFRNQRGQPGFGNRLQRPVRAQPKKDVDAPPAID